MVPSKTAYYDDVYFHFFSLLRKNSQKDARRGHGKVWKIPPRRRERKKKFSRKPPDRARDSFLHVCGEEPAPEPRLTAGTRSRLAHGQSPPVGVQSPHEDDGESELKLRPAVRLHPAKSLTFICVCVCVRVNLPPLVQCCTSACVCGSGKLPTRARSAPPKTHWECVIVWSWKEQKKRNKLNSKIHRQHVSGTNGARSDAEKKGFC